MIHFSKPKLQIVRLALRSSQSAGDVEVKAHLTIPQQSMRMLSHPVQARTQQQGSLSGCTHAEGQSEGEG